MTPARLQWSSVAYGLVALVLAVFTTLPGCDSFDIKIVIDKFDEAIAEVRNLRQTIASEGEKWRGQIDKSQLKLTEDVRTVINEDLRDYTDKTIENVGIEARCTTEFFNQKLLAYLQGVETALIQKRDEIKNKGTLNGQTPEAVIAEVIKAQGRIGPFVCHNVGEIKLEHAEKYGDSPQLRAKEQTLRVTGFALARQPSVDHDKPITLRVSGGGNLRDIANPERLITAPSSYQLILDIQKLMPQLKPEDEKVVLQWDDKTFAEIKLTVGPPPEKPVPPPPAKSVSLVNDIPWIFATCGYGNVQRNHSLDGHTLTINGGQYNTGIGTHSAIQPADSTIHWLLGGNYKTLKIAVFGIDDETGAGTTIDAYVFGDGRELWHKQVDPGPGNPARGPGRIIPGPIVIDVTGVNALDFVCTSPANRSRHAHADWIDPRVQ